MWKLRRSEHVCFSDARKFSVMENLFTELFISYFDFGGVQEDNKTIITRRHFTQQPRSQITVLYTSTRVYVKSIAIERKILRACGCGIVVPFLTGNPILRLTVTHYGDLLHGFGNETHREGIKLVYSTSPCSI